MEDQIIIYELYEKEDKIPIDNVSDIYKHAERLRNTAKIYISDLKS